jgi:hypothetical protein
MKIQINPMPQLILRAERRINFYKVAQLQDFAHDRKRQLAQTVLAGEAPTDEFVRAAEIEGIDVETLAGVIVSKPDVMMEAENARRELIVRVRAATTPAELEQILTEANVGKHPADGHAQLLA